MKGRSIENAITLYRMFHTDSWPFFCELSAFGIQELTSAAVVVGLFD